MNEFTKIDNNLRIITRHAGIHGKYYEAYDRYRDYLGKFRMTSIDKKTKYAFDVAHSPNLVYTESMMQSLANYLKELNK